MLHTRTEHLFMYILGGVIMASASWKTCGLPKCKPHEYSEEVLVTWIPSWNKNRRLISIAVYVPHHHCTTDDLCWHYDETIDLEYCEEQDSWWIPSRWYETITNLIDDCGYVPIDGEVIAWDKMPRPYKPKMTDFSMVEQEGV